MPHTPKLPRPQERTAAGRLAGGLTCVVLSLFAPALTISALASDDSENPRDGERERPLRVRQIEDIQFGRIVADSRAPGVVTIDPETGAKRAGGGATDLGGSHSRAVFELSGEPHAPYVVLLPDEISLEGKGGKTVITDMRTAPEGNGTLGPDGVAVLYVGGKLKLKSGQRGGHYRGRFDIIVEYE